MEAQKSRLDELVKKHRLSEIDVFRLLQQGALDAQKQTWNWQKKRKKEKEALFELRSEKTMQRETQTETEMRGEEIRWMSLKIKIKVPRQGTLASSRKYDNISKKHRKNCECCPGHYLSTSVY